MPPITAPGPRPPAPAPPPLDHFAAGMCENLVGRYAWTQEWHHPLSISPSLLLPFNKIIAPHTPLQAPSLTNTPSPTSSPATDTRTHTRVPTDSPMDASRVDGDGREGTAQPEIRFHRYLGRMEVRVAACGR